MTAPFTGLAHGLYEMLVKQGVPRDVAFAAERAQLEHEGITDEQRKGHTPFSSMLAHVVNPSAAYEEVPMNLGNRVWGGARGLGVMSDLDVQNAKGWPPTKSSQDSWNLYLGLPQENKTFTISNFQPAQAKENKPYYALRDLGWTRAHISNLLSKIEDHAFNDPEERATGPSSVTAVSYNTPPLGKGDLLHFKLSKGEDELGSYISYYDIWDLDPGGIWSPLVHAAGKPFEIYDRVYYNPRTHTPIPEEEILQRRAQLKSQSQRR